jgi:excisionase family DNA binding protein
MTGRDLIVYILTNNLEDEPVFLDKGFLNLISEVEAANRLNVGIATIRAWLELGAIKGVRVGDEIYILPSW